MSLKELKLLAQSIILDLKENGKFPKENNRIDFKLELNISSSKSDLENFLMNFAKDIISFSNSDGGIILIGINEDKTTGVHTETGLNNLNLSLLSKIDLNDLTQKFESLTKIGVGIDLQQFQIGTRKFYYLLIAKSNHILIPKQDFPQYKLYKGAIYYRASGKNEHANSSTIDFNRFLQIKANERSKEFMEIWSKLLPEMFDINPREVLILNPSQNKIYGFNSKDNILSSGEIDIDKPDNGVFNVILNAITAGEVGKITDTEGKPLFKIVGEIQNKEGRKDKIPLSTLETEVGKTVAYKFTNAQLKKAIYYLKWVSSPNFNVINPLKDSVFPEFNDYIWVGKMDAVTDREKVFFSTKAIPVLSKLINSSDLHLEIFNRTLETKSIDIAPVVVT